MLIAVFSGNRYLTFYIKCGIIRPFHKNAIESEVEHEQKVLSTESKAQGKSHC